MGKKKKAWKFPKTIYVHRDDEYIAADVELSEAIRGATDGGDEESGIVATYELVRVERATLQAKLTPIGKKKNDDV